MVDAIATALTAAHAAGRLAMREEAAKVADRQSEWADRQINQNGDPQAIFGTIGNTADDIAAAVRALKVEEG
jgi:hypothetical protein